MTESIDEHIKEQSAYNSMRELFYGELLGLVPSEVIDELDNHPLLDNWRNDIVKNDGFQNYVDAMGCVTFLRDHYRSKKGLFKKRFRVNYSNEALLKRIISGEIMKYNVY